jgi:hypothetical protein
MLVRRLVLAAVVVSLAGLAGGLAVAGAGRVVSARQSQTASRPGGGILAPMRPGGLRRALTQLVGAFAPLMASSKVRPRARTEPALPGPTTCAVGAAGCSLTPCVQFVNSAATPAPDITLYAPSITPRGRSASCHRSRSPGQVRPVALAR